jgi:4'-phosphopantetheinyl transferase
MRVMIFDHMDQCTEAEVQRMLPLVSAQRREQALKYKHTFGQFCCLKSWLMLYDLLDERMKGLMDEWIYNEHGKPSFTPSLLHSFTPYFSISHCKDGIAVAIDDQPIGIDIETIRHADEDLIERTMNEKEQLQITNHQLPIESARAFTRLWTQKEAIVKAQGVGIRSFEQLQSILDNRTSNIETVEKEKYIYSIAYGKLHCIGA